jgi:hypothetical protein
VNENACHFSLSSEVGIFRRDEILIYFNLRRRKKAASSESIKVDE